ncbi:hypothetical protein CKO15_10180 [Halorhodospira abdelmalekii]|uniref:NapC/NirT family cytochrome c n=1 Tax=Halorhodospira abdelmalekii TaxID=421629 RepID=UPI0019050F48|nr:NapC/NirT family cytochrome c [Halorhodospira abdelmalekii]MBK1735644.1 hypothetical protein [Halorhodospira abdelmalekii]
MSDAQQGGRGEGAGVSRSGLGMVLALLAIGVVGGLLLAAGGATMVERTNQTEYCVSCHVYDELYKDYQATGHYHNPTGYKVGCVDCHLPFDNWWDMVWEKADHGIGALWSYYVGGLNTPEAFAEERERLAESVYDWFEESNSKTCRRCHDPAYWDLEGQSETAQRVHARLEPGDGCIRCHRDDAAHPPREEE